MNHEFRLADIGEGLDEAEIIAWRVRVGDSVTRDQPLVEIMTDKSNAELPAPCDGVVVSVGGDVGDIVHVGELLAVIDDQGAASESAMTPGPTMTPGPSVTGPSVMREPGMNAEPNVTADGPADLAAFDPPDAGVSTFQQAAALQADAESGLQVHGATGALGPDIFGAQALVPDGGPGRAPTGAPPARPKASPTTRAKAAQRNIDLTQIMPTGPGGRILLTDLDQAENPELGANAGESAPSVPVSSVAPARPRPIPAPVARARQRPIPAPVAETPAEPKPQPVAEDPPGPAPAQESPAVVPLRGIRRAIAQNMARSWSEIPHIHAFEHLDAEPMLEFRAQLRASGRPEFEHLTPLSFFVAAVAAALREYPQANASLDLEHQTITNHESVNIGIAVAAPQGLVVPVLRNACGLSFAETARELGQIITQARAGSLTRPAFTGGTATITNFGSLGGEQALPLIRPPESVIFGFGSIAPRPFVIDDEVVARQTMNMVIGADHRLLDGDVTTAILGRIVALLTKPINLVLGD